MLEATGQWFNIEYFMPHGHCFLWNPTLLWSMVLGNGIIALSYFSIPLALLITMRRQQNRRMKWVFLMFSAFIFACGMTHVIDIAVIWYPNYYLDAGFKLATATVSAITAVALWPIVGRARAYMLEQATTNEVLMTNNQQLKKSIAALRQNHLDLKTLNRMSGYIEVCNDLTEVCNTVIDTVEELWPNSSGTVYLAAPKAHEFLPGGSWGGAPAGDTVSALTCWSHRLSTPFPDAEAQSRQQCKAADCGLKTQKYCLPINAGGKTLGLLHIEGLAMPLDERSRTILPLLIERAGLAIYNMQLHMSLEFQSTRDALTELFNRRYMDEALQIEIDRAERNATELSLVIFDLDHFKRLNDTHGHDVGDKALRLFADILRANLRTGDIACRYGGEEFVLILPATDRGCAIEVGERIRIALEVNSDEDQTETVLDKLTVSAGVASLAPDCRSVDDLIQRADQALYEAKHAGRNRVKAA